MPTSDNSYSQLNGEMVKIRSMIAGVAGVVNETHDTTQKMDHTIHALQISFENLYRILHEKLEKISGQLVTIEKVPGMLKQLQETMVGQFELAFLRAFEAQIVSQMSGVLANENRIKALGTFLNEKHAQLETNCQRVAGRYDQLLDKLAENNKERRKKLDSHAYELLERIYPHQVQPAFDQVVQPFYSFLSAHAVDASRARTNALGEAFARLCDDVREFQAERDRTYETIGKWLIKDWAEGAYELRVRVVETEDIATGRRSVEIMPLEGGESLPPAVREAIRKQTLEAVRDAKREALAPGEIDALAAALRTQGGTTDGEIERLRRDRPQWIGSNGDGGGDA